LPAGGHAPDDGFAAFMQAVEIGVHRRQENSLAMPPHIGPFFNP
jgi:hypothetical protein